MQGFFSLPVWVNSRMKNPFSSVAATKEILVVLCRRVNEVFITHSGKQSNKLKGTQT